MDSSLRQLIYLIIWRTEIRQSLVAKAQLSRQISRKVLKPKCQSDIAAASLSSYEGGSTNRLCGDVCRSYEGTYRIPVNKATLFNFIVVS